MTDRDSDKSPTLCSRSRLDWQSALRTVNSGIIVAEGSTGDILFANDYAKSLCEAFVDEMDVKSCISSVTNTENNDGSIGVPCSNNNTSRQVIHSNGRTVGISTYSCAEDQYVIFMKDISADSIFLESVIKNDDTATILTIFSQLRHEIGNPLNSMKMTLQVLKENLDRFGLEKIHSYIDRSVGEIARLEHLLDSLRQVTAQDAISLTRVDLEQSISSFVQLVSEKCRASNAKVETRVDTEARYVMANNDSLLQILHNLMDNSIEARQGDSVHIQIHAKFDVQTSMVCIDFADDGIGIPRHCLPLVFRHMYSTKANGMGLGLALVEGLMKRMQGKVRVTSEPGRQTLFQLYLTPGNE